jgi:hypothetical protein
VTRYIRYATQSTSYTLAPDKMRFNGNLFEETSSDTFSGKSSVWKFSYVTLPSGVAVSDTCLCTQHGTPCNSTPKGDVAFYYTATAQDVRVYDSYSSADPGRDYSVTVYTRM